MITILNENLTNLLNLFQNYSVVIGICVIILSIILGYIYAKIVFQTNSIFDPLLWGIGLGLVVSGFVLFGLSVQYNTNSMFSSNFTGNVTNFSIFSQNTILLEGNISLVEGDIQYSNSNFNSSLAIIGITFALIALGINYMSEVQNRSHEYTKKIKRDREQVERDRSQQQRDQDQEERDCKQQKRDEEEWNYKYFKIIPKYKSK